MCVHVHRFAGVKLAYEVLLVVDIECTIFGGAVNAVRQGLVVIFTCGRQRHVFASLNPLIPCSTDTATSRKDSWQADFLSTFDITPLGCRWNHGKLRDQRNHRTICEDELMHDCQSQKRRLQIAIRTRRSYSAPSPYSRPSNRRCTRSAIRREVIEKSRTISNRVLSYPFEEDDASMHLKSWREIIVLKSDLESCPALPVRRERRIYQLERAEEAAVRKILHWR